MRTLTESMKGLKDAVKQQEMQISKYIITNEEDQRMKKDSQSCIQDRNFNGLPQAQFAADVEHLLGLHGVASDTSQVSHWSWSLGSINSSIDDLKVVLKSQDTQVIKLTRENEELKNELKKKNKEIKKHKFLLRAEREAFEKYKKDTLNVIKKQNIEEEDEEEDEIPETTSKELLKIKSELAHYSQMCIEQRHTMNRLSKIITTLRDDNLKLKDKLLLQEKQYNKFILEMAQRFKISRKEFQLVITKLQTSAIAPTNLAVCKIADRNARLAYDNCMLKLELNGLREKFFQRKSNENTMQCTAVKSDILHNQTEKNIFVVKNEKDDDLKKGSPLKASTSELSGLSGNTNLNLKCAVKTSVTNLIERNSRENVSMSQPVPEALREGLSNESFEVMRTESAPQLRMNNQYI